MAEMPDVVTLTTISSNWGNSIRDRTIQRYSSVANRTTEHPTPTEGDLSYLEDTNTVEVFTGSAWEGVGGAWTPVAGGAMDNSSAALTPTLTDKASVVFTKPTSWVTYALVAWGFANIDSAVTAGQARVEIGASNGATNSMGGPAPMTLPCFHSVTAQTASSVTVALAVANFGGDATYDSSTIQYIAYRLT